MSTKEFPVSRISISFVLMDFLKEFLDEFLLLLLFFN